MQLNEIIEVEHVCMNCKNFGFIRLPSSHVVFQEARARHLLLDLREAELEKVMKLTGSLQSMSKVTILIKF